MYIDMNNLFQLCA